MNTVAMATVQTHLKQLRLPAVARKLPQALRLAEADGMPYLDFLRILLDAEVDQRRANQSQRRIAQARFPYVRALDGFDFTANPSIARAQILSLAQGDFIREHRSVILQGSVGTGKTHLAIALGREACVRGFKVRFYTASALVNELMAAQAEFSLAKVEKRWLKWELVIVDELGYIPFTRTGAELLFQFFSLRYERGSMLVTTNLDFDRWTDVFGDAQLTTALLDRITHKAIIISTNGPSYRFRESMEQRKGVTPAS